MNIAAFDVGGTTIQYTIGDPEGEFYVEPAEVAVETDPAAQIVNLLSRLQREYSVDAVSIATAGPLVYEKQMVKRLATLNNGIIRDIRFGEALIEAGIPADNIYIENDTNAAVLAEYWFGVGDQRDVADIMYITFSTGIGAGAVQDGHIHSGATGNAGKIGTFPLAPEFQAITEKTKGCWEELCGGKGIPDLVERLMKEESRETVLREHDRVSARMLYEAAKTGDSVAREIVLETIGDLNARGTAVTALSFDPKIITVGGSIALHNPELVIDPIRNRFKDYYAEKYGYPEVTRTGLGANIELYGALRIPSCRDTKGQSIISTAV